MDDYEEGYCGGHTVHLDDGEYCSVLGPDGEPVKLVTRHPIGFDLSTQKQPQPEGNEQ